MSLQQCIGVLHLMVIVSSLCFDYATSFGAMVITQLEYLSLLFLLLCMYVIMYVCYLCNYVGYHYVRIVARVVWLLIFAFLLKASKYYNKKKPNIFVLQ